MWEEQFHTSNYGIQIALSAQLRTAPSFTYVSTPVASSLCRGLTNSHLHSQLHPLQQLLHNRVRLAAAPRLHPLAAPAVLVKAPCPTFSSILCLVLGSEIVVKYITRLVLPPSQNIPPLILTDRLRLTHTHTVTHTHLKCDDCRQLQLKCRQLCYF